jgi:hypothetical protein
MKRHRFASSRSCASEADETKDSGEQVEGREKRRGRGKVATLDDCGLFSESSACKVTRRTGSDSDRCQSICLSLVWSQREVKLGGGKLNATLKPAKPTHEVPR